VVSSGKFVRVVILPLSEKITLVERRKVLERDRLVVGIVPYKLLNRDVAFP
jgi:hypothetical protein